METKREIVRINIIAAKDGKRAAFNYLLNTFWDIIYSYQLKRTQSKYDAEEITIQTFAKAFSQIQSFDEDLPLTPWLLTISKNLHIDLVRKRKHMQKVCPIQQEIKLRRVLDDGPTPEDALISQQDHAKLQRYIKQMKPHYQTIINLRYFEEMSYKEMSYQLEEPMNNVKVKLLRAKRLLADLIEKNQ